MWTYRNPYRPSEFTREYLENRGRVALYRSLNIGRVIAFVGSGVSRAYGGPSWSELVEKIAKVALDHFELAKKAAKAKGTKLPSATQVLAESLSVLTKKKSTTVEEKKQTMLLAEKLAERLGTLNKIKFAIAKEWYGPDPHTSLLPINLASDDPVGFKRLRNLIDGVKVDQEAEISKMRSNADPLSPMISVLGIRRFLTLNYDVEIERAFQKQFRVSGHGAAQSDFEILCQPVESHEADENREEKWQASPIYDLPRRVEYRDAARRSVVSISMNPDNVGQLVSFALHPGQFQAQVVHLHGRFDKPEDMILTEPDYQRTYHRTGELQNTFDEALTTLFGGNDVLFVGVGLDEPEMLRPLRQFVSEDDGPDISRRHIFALFENKVALDTAALARKPRDLDLTGGEDLNAFFLRTQLDFRNWLDKRWSGSSIESDLHADEAKARSLYSQYGVYCIFFGSEVLRAILLATQFIEKAAGNIKLDADHVRAARDALVDRLGVFQDKSREDYLESAPQLFTKSEYGLLINVLLDDPADKSKRALKLRLEISKWFANEARSRALHQHLLGLQKNQRDWWRDLSVIPKSRDASYARTYAKKGKKKHHPLMARHRPYYSRLDSAGRDDPWQDICALRELQREAKRVAKDIQTQIRSDGAKGYKVPTCYNRVSRDDRGYDSNWDLLLDGPRDLIEVPPRRVVRVAMARGNGKGALLDILRQETSNGLAFNLDQLFGEPSRYHASFVLHLSFSMEFASVIEALEKFFRNATLDLAEADKGFMSKIKKLKTEPRTHSEFIDHLVEEKGAIVSRIRSYFALDRNRSGPGRNHRLESLRVAIEAFTDAVDLLGNVNRRVLIVMSGIDKLCDANGTAHNPMFRAFFRLLTGCGPKYPSESDCRVPMDLLLISGDPKTPTRYLSDEIERDDLNDSLRQKSSPSKVRYSSYLNYREADPQHFMKVWPLLPGLTLAEHYWLEPYDEWREFSAQLQNGEKEHPVLIRLLEDSVALSTWCFGAYRVHQVSRDIAGLGAGSNPAKRFLQELEAIASRGGQNDLIEFIFSEHSHFFRLSAKKGAFGLGVLDQPQHLAELGDLLFVHLSLFPLPVEPSVLDESPEIRRLLLKLVAPGVIKPDSQHYKPLRLDLLCKVLLHFEQHNLLIRVRPKPLKPGDVLKPKPTDAVRDRFTLQHQLRDYVGFKMDLHIPDQGERNYFQVSIFPDQPKDLPSPLAAHYKMIRELMDRQINYSRLALWCLYQLRKHALDESSGESYAFLPKTQRTYAQDGLKRRLTDETGGVDNSLEIYHQVSQRTRALYGLLRSGFSLGTISRLPSIDQSGEPDQPYERFGGWLRGLCNTAIGLETWQDTLKQLYRGELGADIQKEVWGTNMPHRKAFQKNLPIPRPFYRDELGWIYNERGLLKLVQGKIYDAIPLFRNALEIMHHHGERKNDPALNAAVRRVQLNLALARLERGNLETARRMLSGLILPKDSSSHSGSQVSWIARGYLALIDHIGGSFDRVEGVYEETIALANTRGMLRLEAIVNRHWSDLLRRKGDLDSALEKVNKSISTARQAEQRDVLHYARLAKSRILLANGETGSTELVHSVLKAVQFAQSMGVPRLECEALRIHAEIMLAQGERILAGQTAARSAAIANRHGLRLLKLSSLRVYGLALAKRQQLEFARTIITETRREAEHRDYQGLTGRLSADLDDLPLGFAK